MKTDSAALARTANLLGALALAVSDRLVEAVRFHPNQTDTAAAALHLIGAYGGCSNSELSQALRLSHPATVRLVDRLEEAGHVRAEPGRDRRSTALHLTASGRNLVRSTGQRRASVLIDVAAALSAAQRSQFDALSEVLLSVMTTSAVEGTAICRLCNDADCPPQSCPVHQAAERRV